ncbi:hypothetical protein ACFUYE_15025 [Micromonospora humida]|uniref:hypothetical protein n=1 Tax=Micromonospora humida TaxID=2809018 RepID=UPI0036732285
MDSRCEPYDPFAEAEDPDGDYETTMRTLGWERFLTVGEDPAPLYITTWRRTMPDGGIEYAFDVWGIDAGSPFFKVATFPELMDLVARWAPAVQAAHVSAFLGDLAEVGGLSTMGVVERVAARAAFGVKDALPEIRSAEREAARLYRQQQARRQQPVAPAR